MRKILALAVAVLCMVSLHAQEKVQSGPPKPSDNYTFFQLGFFPGIPGSMETSNVYGLKLGAPMVCGYGRAYGIEPSFFYSGTDYIKGVQAAWVGYSDAKEVLGLQASMGTCNVNEFKGIQTGAVCVAETGSGIQLSGVGVIDDIVGIQGGIVNVADYVEGLQLGAFNYSSEGAFQIGAINYIENGLVPCMILMNVSF